TASYQARQQSSSAGLSVTVLGTGSPSASLSSARLIATGDYASATEQSGLQTGDGGFDVEVGGNTGLKGGVIASSETAIVEKRNRLTTGTLTTEDLANHSTAFAEASGLSFSTDMLTQGKYGIAKSLIANTALNGERSGASSGRTRSAIGEGEIVITDEQKQQEFTGRTTEEAIALLNRDIDNSHSAAEKQDADRLRRQVEAEQVIKRAIYTETVKFSDEAYRTMFLRDHPFYEVLRDENGRALVDPETGEQKLRLLSEEEKRNLKPGPDGKIHITANGIFNDEEAAAKYALQHASDSGPQYLVYFPEANNVLSELMVAGYQRFLEGDLLGLTNSTVQVKDAMSLYGQSGLHLDGHSRGAMTIGNAMESLESTSDALGTLSGTTINFFGPAYNTAQADDLLSGLQNRTNLPEETQTGMVLMYQNHVADPVGSIIGNNPPTGGTIPQGSSVLEEMVRAATGQPDTSHNLYYVDDANFKPELKIPERQKIIDDFWSGTTPILTPAR
uniref:hypothetical protein n=1 Tax=Sedimenticola hydrogenitrophicus TaxID=2967975 RepID=UPI002FF7CFF0